jgi:hypothetical protein
MSERDGHRRLCSTSIDAFLILRLGFGGEVFDLPVGHGGQSGEDVPEVGEGIESAPAAAFMAVKMMALRAPMAIATRSSFTSNSTASMNPPSNSAVFSHHFPDEPDS